MDRLTSAFGAVSVAHLGAIHSTGWVDQS